MSENLERSLSNVSAESNGDDASDFLEQRDNSTFEIIKMLNSIREETNFRDNLTKYQAIHRHLMFLKDLDPEYKLTAF
jgi:hypothetical protein